MKARIKKTGEIVNISEYAKIALDQCDSWGCTIEVKPEEIELIQKPTEDEYWRGYREGKQEILDKYTELEKQGEQKPIKTCAEYYNKDRELKMPVLSEFQDKLADILMHREYDGPDETEDDIAKGRLEYELAAIRLSEELLPLAQKEQKPAEWHREDEQNLNACLGYIPDEFLRRWLTDVVHVKYDKPADKDKPKFRVGDTIHKIGENTIFPMVIEEIKNGEYVCDNNHSFITIKFQDDYELVEQKPAGWSEEDENYINDLIKYFSQNEKLENTKEDIVCWLKSIKDRYTWKPSDKELGALLVAIGDERQESSDVAKELLKIYHHLKKLKG